MATPPDPAQQVRAANLLADLALQWGTNPAEAVGLLLAAAAGVAAHVGTAPFHAFLRRALTATANGLQCMDDST